MTHDPLYKGGINMMKRLITIALSAVLLASSLVTAFATEKPEDRFSVRVFNTTSCMLDTVTHKYYIRCTSDKPDSYNRVVPDGYFTEMTGTKGWEEWKIPDNFYDTQKVMVDDKEYQICVNNKKVAAYYNGELDEKLTENLKSFWDYLLESKFAEGGFEDAVRLVFCGETVGYLNNGIYVEMAGRVLPMVAQLSKDKQGEYTRAGYVIEPMDELSYDIKTMIGDATLDGALDMVDVTTTQKSIAKLDDKCNTILADIDENGNVDLQDVVQMQRTIAGLI